MLHNLVVYTGLGLGYFLIEHDKYSIKKHVYFNNMERFQKEEFNNIKRIELGKTKVIEHSNSCFIRVHKEVNKSCYVIRDKLVDSNKTSNYFVYLSEKQVLQLVNEEVTVLEVYNFSKDFKSLLTTNGLLLDTKEFVSKDNKHVVEDKLTKRNHKFKYSMTKGDKMAYTEALKLYDNIMKLTNLEYIMISFVFLTIVTLIIYIIKAINFLVSKEKVLNKNYRGEVTLYTLMLVLILPFFISNMHTTDDRREKLLGVLAQITEEQLNSTETINVGNIKSLTDSNGCLFITKEDMSKNCYNLVVGSSKYLDIDYYVLLSKDELLQLDKGLSLEVYKPTKEFKEFTDKFPAILDKSKYLPKKETLYGSILFEGSNKYNKLFEDNTDNYIPVTIYASFMSETAIQVKKVNKVW